MNSSLPSLLAVDPRYGPPLMSLTPPSWKILVGAIGYSVFSMYSKLFLNTCTIYSSVESPADEDRDPPCWCWCGCGCGCGCGSSMIDSIIHFLFNLRMRMRNEDELGLRKMNGIENDLRAWTMQIGNYSYFSNWGTHFRL